MLQTSIKARNQTPTGKPYLTGVPATRLIEQRIAIKNADFDSIIADYLPTTPKLSLPDTTIIPPSAPKSANYLDGLY